MYEAHCKRWKCNYEVKGPVKKSVKDTLAAHMKLAHSLFRRKKSGA
jgi:predicted small metal-binding protein|tara:strand:+ start:2255 stop:2392 length:138 start_codon:yes stop_codon:yes gene_type:complete